MIAAPEHDELNEHLNAYLDGELDAALRARVEAHLQTCAACRLDLVQLHDTKRALHALPALRAPRPFTLEAPSTALPRRPGLLSLPWLGWAWRLGSIAAAACLLLAFVAGARSPAAFSTSGAASTSQENAPSGSAGSGPSPADRAASQRVAPQHTPAPGAGGASTNTGASGSQNAFAPTTRAAVPAQSAPPGQGPAAPAPQARRQDGATPPDSPAQPGSAAQQRDAGALAAEAVETGSRAPDWRLVWLTAGGTLAVASAAAFALDRLDRRAGP